MALNDTMADFSVRSLPHHASIQSTKPRTSRVNAPEEHWEVVWCKDSWHLVADRLSRILPSWASLTIVDDTRPVAEQVANARVLIPTTGTVNADVIRAAKHLQLIVNPASGYNNIDIEEAKVRGVPVCIAPGVNAQSVAEQALMMMLMLARKAEGQRQAFQQGVIGQPVGRQLKGKTLGIVGMGAIGTALCAAAIGLGMSVLGCTSRSTRAEFEHLLRESDVISIHCPVTDTTKGLFGPVEFSLMREGALLLNLARGEIIDKQALESALHSGRLGGVGLDVHWVEPADPLDPLYRHPSVLAMPHAGVCSEEVFDAYATLLRDNIVRCRNGSELMHRLV